MAQTTIASFRNFQSQRYVLPQLQDIRNDKKRRKAVNHSSTVVAATAVNQSNAVNSRFFNISEIISKTYSIFPTSISFDFGLGDPLPSLVIKYSQLNSASAGHAKIPVRLAVKYLQQAASAASTTTTASIDKFGDDACFILNSKRKDYIGVADGVGGWRSRGYDPSAFSSSLLTICKDIAQKKPMHDPYRLIDNSYKKLLILNKQKNFGIIGSSTVCILTFDHMTGVLQTANLGDSGFLLVRNKEVIKRSQKQTHTFNTPKQLAYAPPTIKCIADHPSDASQLNIQCQPGDIIVTATDGLFDNINENMILNEIQKLPDADEITKKDLDIAAKSLANLARRKAKDKSFLSPFSLAAKSAGFDYKGGKVDDITVIVSCVSDLGTEV